MIPRGTVFVRPDRTRELNRKRVLAELRRGSTISRTEISRHTGLSAATVSAITSDFIDEGLVQANAPEASGRGRPTMSLVLEPDVALICAVYFEFSTVSATFVDYAGETVANFKLPLTKEPLTRVTIRSALIECIKQTQNLVDTKLPLSQIAVGFQGVTSIDGTTVLWSPITSDCDLPISSWLQETFAVPTRVSNDCDMIVRALNWKEPERYGRNFAAILLTHGVGMGLCLRGDIVNGTQSSGIEFGHMTYMPDGALCRCGNHGCIEAYAGEYAISRSASGQPELSRPNDLRQASDLAGIRDRALAGDSAARTAVESAGKAIGSGIANLYSLVDEFPIALVGQGTILFEQMEKPIRTALATAPGARSTDPVDIACYTEDGTLVREGCAITALMEIDTRYAMRKEEREAVA